MIAIIGGSGFYELLENPEEIKVHTPYGNPSDNIFKGELSGKKILFLPRHGRGHSIPPHKINYRANIWALKELGAERIISIFAVGSLKEEYKPGDIVFVDQFIDFTKHRPLTFYDGPKVVHISIPEPFCPELRDIFIQKAKELGIEHKERGTYICIEGPRFSTKAESKMFRQFADVIGMTLVPEINLARELGLCFLGIGMITDYDVWKEKVVDVKEVLETMAKNVGKVKQLLKEGIGEIPDIKGCSCGKVLEGAEV